MSELERLNALYKQQTGEDPDIYKDEEEEQVKAASQSQVGSTLENENERLNRLWEEQTTSSSTQRQSQQREETPQQEVPKRSRWEDFQRKAGIATGGFLEGVAESLEFVPKTVGGAIDEAAQWMGVTEPGNYPVRDTIDEIVRFDEIAEQISPKKDRAPETPFEFGLEAGSRGMGSAFGITGPLATVGRGSLTPAQMGSQNLSTLQRSTISSGQPLRTPTDVLRTGSTPTSPQIPASLAQKTAAAPRATMATESIVSGGAGLGAAQGAASASTPEEMRAGAESGELKGTLIGAFTPAGLSAMKTMANKGPTGVALNWLWRKGEPVRTLAKDIYDREAFRDLTLKQKLNPHNWRTMINERAIEKYGRRDVLQHLRKLVPTKDMEGRIAERIRAVTRLQEIAPEFSPSLGALIGTPESKAFQQVVDFQNPDLALEIYNKNQAAMKKIRAALAKDPTSKYSNELADIMETMSDDTKLILDGLQQRIDNNAAHLLESVTSGAGLPVEEGQALRDHLSNMKAVYKKVKDDLYAMVEVPKEVKFKVDDLANYVSSLQSPTNPDNVIGSNVTTLRTSLYQALKESVDRVTDPETGEKLGPATMDYDLLSRYISRLGDDYRDLKSTNPNSPHLKTISNTIQGIENIIDKGIDSLPEKYSYVKKARENAKAFFRDEYVPRFREGALYHVQKVNPDGTYQVADDSVMSKFWQQGDKTQGSTEFKKLFQDFAAEGADDFDADQYKVLAENSESAKKSLERYALHTLSTDLSNAAKAKTNPVDILNAWRKKYRGALSEFPEISEKTKDIETVFNTIADQHQQFAAQRDHLTKSIINKYFNTDPEEVVKKFMSSGRSADKILGSVDSIYGAGSAKSNEIRNALETATINKILNDSVDPATGKFQYRKVATMMEEGKESLPKILGQDNYEKLLSFNQGLRILDDQPGLIAQAELNSLAEFLNKAGVSPASILSRYYSASLGKVGPVYLAADAATRFINKRAEAYFQDLYKELMYDPNTLTDLDNLLKDANFMSQASSAPSTQAPRLALIMSMLGVRVGTNQMDEEVPEGVYPQESDAESEVNKAEAAVNPVDEEAPLVMEIPEGTEDGIYEDAEGNRVNIRGGKAYGL